LENLNSLAYAYIGDAVYELHVRKYLICKGVEKVKFLQETAIKYVSAKSQEKSYDYLLENNLLTDKEKSLILRGRNHKVHSKPNGVSYITYKKATGLENLIGYLYINKNFRRLEELLNIIVEERYVSIR